MRYAHHRFIQRRPWGPGAGPGYFTVHPSERPTGTWTGRSEWRLTDGDTSSQWTAARGRSPGGSWSVTEGEEARALITPAARACGISSVRSPAKRTTVILHCEGNE